MQIPSFLFERFRAVLKYQLYQHHITNRSTRDRYQHLAFPKMKPHCNNHCNQFRQSVASSQNLNIFQAVDYQHAKDCGRQRFPQILYVFGRGLPLPENQKRQESCRHRSQCADSDGYDLLQERHDKPPAFSIGRRNAVRQKKIHSILGIKKESGPKTVRQTADANSPIHAV